MGTVSGTTSDHPVGLELAWRRARTLQAEQGLLDADQVAAELGVSPQHVRKLARRRGIGRRHPTPSPGGMHLFTQADVELLRRRPSKAEATAERVARLRQQLAELKEREDLVDVAEVMKELDRSKPAVITLAKAAGVGRQVPGPGGPEGLVWVFTRDELAILSARSKAHWVHGNPRHRAHYYFRRFGSRRMYGRLAPALAALKGVTVGRQPSLTEGEVRRAREMRGEGKSYRAIAIALEKPGSYQAVRRALAE